MIKRIKSWEFAEMFNVDPQVLRKKLTSIGLDHYIDGILAKAAEPVQMHWFDFAVASLMIKDVKNVLEIGTRRAESTVVFAKLFPEATIYTIDTRNPASDFPVFGRDLGDSLGNLGDREKNLDYENIVAVRANSFFLPLMDLPEQFELIFVDGAHMFPQVAGDIMFAYGRISPGGFLFMHDYSTPHSNHVAGVAITIDTIAPYLEETIFTFPHWSFLSKHPNRFSACLIKGGIGQYLRG